jgi:hypothetical protein
LLDEDTISEPTDKAYWENRASKASVKLTEKILAELGDLTSEYNLKYNKHYIGLEKNNIANNFVSFIPRKTVVIANIKLEKIEEIDELLESSDFDTLPYDKQWKNYRLRLNAKDVASNMELIKDLITRAKSEYRS